MDVGVHSAAAAVDGRGTAGGCWAACAEGRADSVRGTSSAPELSAASLGTAVAAAQDACLLVSASYVTTLRLWKWRAGACLQVLRGHDGPVSSACCLSGGRRLLSADGHGCLLEWPSASPQHAFAASPATEIECGDRTGSGGAGGVICGAAVGVARACVCTRAVLVGSSEPVQHLVPLRDRRVAAGGLSASTALFSPDGLVPTGTVLRHSGWCRSFAELPDELWPASPKI
jgi:hypothetical protein